MEEHEITLTMAATSALSRDALEDMTFRAQEALTARAADLALGAAASANFAENSIEVDFVVLVASAAEVHERVAAVMRVLEDAGFNNADHLPKTHPAERFALSSSSTHAVAQPVCA